MAIKIVFPTPESVPHSGGQRLLEIEADALDDLKGLSSRVDDGVRTFYAAPGSMARAKDGSAVYEYGPAGEWVPQGSGGSSGPSEVVILPETELTPFYINAEGARYQLFTPFENRPTAAGTYKIVWNGVEYTSPVVDVQAATGATESMLAVGNSDIMDATEMFGSNPAPDAPFLCILTPDGNSDDGTSVYYLVFAVGPDAIAEPPILSIVQVGAESGDGSASAGGGGFIVNATIGEIDPEVMSADCTFDKTFEETLAAIKAGQYVACHAMVEGMCIFRAVSYEETAITFSITLGQTEMQIIMFDRGGGSFILQGE